ncbi:MAG: hypothetical protein KDI46_03365 [Alphaproteobacteria bacterium]|nr:hypothetical protein [Alphaproteobacteria bacterium]
MRKLLLLQFLVLVCVPLPLWAAQQIQVRAGDHKDYARLVFDWPKATPYSVQKQSDSKLEITFKADAQLAGKDLETNPVANIEALEVISSSPLRVALSVSAGSSIRDFMVGSRIILDVYNPPGGKGPAKPLRLSTTTEGKETAAPEALPEEKKSEPLAENTKIEEVTKTEDHTPEIPHAEKAVSEEHSVMQPPVEPEIPEAEHTESKPTSHENPDAHDEHKTHDEPATNESTNNEKTIKLKPSATPTLVTLSSTESFGLAAFENAGRLWIINDRDDLIAAPAATGPKAKELGLARMEKKEGMQSYTVIMPSGDKIKGHGERLLWRLMFSPDLKVDPATAPVREGVSPNKSRSGKLVFTLQDPRRKMEVTDPLTGDKLIVISVGETDESVNQAQDYIDFEILNSPVGLAIRSKVDDLEVTVKKSSVEITRPGGLALIDESKANAARHMKEARLSYGAATEPQIKKSTHRIFDFVNWRMGGLKALAENRTVLLGHIKDLDEGKRAENLLTLAKAYIANGIGPEALGILNLAAEQIPDLDQGTEFIALRGVARALSGKTEQAFDDLSQEKLQSYPEVQIWRAYVLGQVGDWQQAADVLPKDVASYLYDLTPQLQSRLSISAAEILLRSGETKRAEEVIFIAEQDKKSLLPGQKAALEYLKGERARQEHDLKTTKKFWNALVKGSDDLYRAKAGLALARLLLDEKETTPGKAIDRLERLRYAWRGDDIEAQINYQLGKLYFDRGEYVKGLSIMRDATTYTSTKTLSRRIAADMSEAFSTLFLDKKLEGMSALDAVTLYEQFSELVPPDARGDQIVERLAEHLVNADLLGRAGELLNYQVNHRLEGYEAFRIALRLAAIRLLDSKPAEAIAALNFADMKFQELPEELKTEQNRRNLALLRARALSKQGRPDKALEMLSEMQLTPDVNRLRADIAWQAAYWDDAAEALRDVILDQNISLTRPLNEENTDLLLRRAIALSLDNDRVALANMREKYTDLMNQSAKAKVFEVITRPRQSMTLSDRETLLSIVSEVDLFSDVLNNLKSISSP